MLKCEQGFVGFKTNGYPRLECNKATYETIQVEKGTDDKGVVYFKGQNGKYLCPVGDEISAEADQPHDFYIELREPTRICIKSGGGQYLNGEKNGVFRLVHSEPEKATKWEF